MRFQFIPSSIFSFIFIMLMTSPVISAPSRFDVMKTMKWRVVEVLEKNLHSGLFTLEEKNLLEQTSYKIKSSIGQYTNREYFEDIYYQTFNLVKIKKIITDSDEKNKIDNLIEFYQAILKEMYKEE